ncbi:YceI family protein [Sphingobacterium sp. SGR-19]|uniref:YceI family protein n=1 Tax=Sphingobacterium sp. SGR-19 TaxID=2710886 RepID=UPI0013ECAA5B|nr:YceI family protein [Sphingobacterium sp. SGR-19]NGM66899.1 YceI family protein [Sphingobacterium sp. SGR-19]
MKKLSALTIVAALALAACGGNSNADKVQTSTAQEVATERGTVFHLDPANSSIKWKAYHKGGFDPRFGTLDSEGSLTLENDTIASGKFTIDMNSLRTDENAVDVAKTGGKTAADLDGHLKNEDFFEVEKYPTAKLDITSVRPFDPAKDKSVLADATNIISGNLTIKEKTVNVSFPAKVSIQENSVNVQSKFSINRQDWGLTYGTDGDPKDWMISQEVDLEFDITAKK